MFPMPKNSILKLLELVNTFSTVTRWNSFYKISNYFPILIFKTLSPLGHLGWGAHAPLWKTLVRTICRATRGPCPSALALLQPTFPVLTKQIQL